MSNLKERYRIHNKSKSNKPLMKYMLIFAVLIFSTSFSRYVTENGTTLGMNVAKWNIKVNDKTITQATTLIKNEIDLVITDNKTDDGIIKPGQKGYFDIVIDPQYTEVSLKYKITLDISGLPSQIQIPNYSLNNLNTKLIMPNNKILQGNILLDGGENLDSTSKKYYRVYWQWPIENGKIENIKSNYKVKANVKIEQLIDV